MIRGNQGDCVKVTLRNQLEFGEDVSLHINGSSMVVSKTGQPATTTNPDAIAYGPDEECEENCETTPVDLECTSIPIPRKGGGSSTVTVMTVS